MAILALDETHYRLTLSGLGADFSDVEFPTWSEKNGQDDIK